MDSWADSKGIPSSYKVHAVTVSDLKASSAEVFLDTTPRASDTRILLGTASNLKHELAMDFAIKVDTTFIKKMNASDSSGAYLSFNLLKSLYRDKRYPSDSLDVDEELDLTLSWKIETSSKKKFADSLSEVTDSMWYASLADWEDASSADTTFSISLSNFAARKDSTVFIELPNALLSELRELKRFSRVQLKLSLPNATRAYRFYGEDTDYPPYLNFWRKNVDSDSIYYSRRIPSRLADVIANEEDCKECLVLHGGVFDSLVVELPPEPILKALSDFYGDDFPVTEDEKFDVRQYVILAQLTMARDDSKGNQEFGLPIQVVVGSYVDSVGKAVRKMENYRLNDSLIVQEGHPNLIFHDGDSLSVQLTYGLRDFINRARDGRSVKFMMRIGYPFLQEKMTSYQDTIVEIKGEDGKTSYDTIPRFLPHFDYARYDFSSILENSMTLKIWVASKRSKEED
ncbi:MULTISPECIES: hypothetical protein [unclassified Fibrobacter]|uniref:hypothetical protein n=1 Tax=unclassified Fibrobacter TaxID=2634177 RepID=UPI000D6D29B0|nr:MULTISPECIES: hypothetical protein [unclassified Fibrobacter]